MTVAIKPLGPSVGPAVVADAERQLSSHFPEDYRRFLLQNNGAKPQSNHFDIPQTRSGLGVRSFFGILGIPKHGDLLYEQKILMGRLPQGIIAIASDECGNRVCLSVRPEDYGHVFFWDHELESEGDLGAPLADVAPSFDRFLGSLQYFDPDSV